MAFMGILSEIDEEIAKLKQARALLANDLKRGPGRPRKSAPDVTPVTKKKKHKMTPEGRKRIAEAVKRRWAAQKKAA